MNKKIVFLVILTFLLLPSTQAVTSVTISIQSGTQYTDDETPSMSIGAENIGTNPTMSFSCNGNANLFSEPVAFDTDYNQFNIKQNNSGCTNADGEKTVTVKVVDSNTPDGARNSDSIILDTTGPVISNQSPANGTRTGNQPTIGFSFDDAGIGIGNEAQLSLIINGGNPIHAPELVVNMTTKNATYAPQTPLSDGTTDVNVGAFDDLGNISVTTWSFIVDANAHLASISINGGSLYARSRDANMSAQGDSDLSDCQFRMDGGSYSGVWIPFGTSMAFQLSEGDGNKTVWGQCKDALEHLTEEQSDIILLDRTGPSTPSPSISNIQSNQVTLNWGDVTDTGSGLKEFQILNLTTGTSVANGIGSTLRTYGITGLSSNTAYNFRLIARDYALNESYGETGTTTLQSNNNNNNSSGDTVAPTISWLKPDANAVLSGKVKLRVQVNDNNGVKSVTFYLDKIDITQLLDWIPYNGTNQIEIEWDSAKVSNGNHELFAEVNDWSGNTAQASRKIKVQNADENQGNDQNQSPEEPRAKTALANAKTEQQKAKAAIDLAKQFSFDSSEAQGKYSEGLSKKVAAQKEFDQNNFLESETNAKEAIALFQEAVSKTGLSQESRIVLGEPGTLDFKGIFSASKLNPALAVFAEEIQSQMETERHLIVFKRTTEDSNAVFFVRVELKIKNNSGADNDFIVVELVPKALTQTSDELVGNPEFVVLEKDPLLEWKLDGFKNGQEIVVSYTIDKTFSEQEIQALLNSAELNSYKLAPLIVKASAVQNTPMLLVSPSLLGLEFLTNPTALAIIIGILVILAFVFLVWQKNRAPRWPGRNAW